MHSLTFYFNGPPHKAPIGSQVGDPVICQLHPDYLALSTNGTPYVLGEVKAVSNANQRWQYDVQIEDHMLTQGAVALGKFVPCLHSFTAPNKWFRTVVLNYHGTYEVFGPTESIHTGTRWVGNPDFTGTIVAVRISTHTAGTGTVQLSLAGTHLFEAPVSLAGATSRRITLEAPIAAGQRINAITATNAVYGLARGLQIEVTIQP